MIDFHKYLMAIAKTAASRSKDPYYKVGAAAATAEKRIIGLGYNGTAPGFKEPKNFHGDRDARRPFMVHAEQNICSLFTRDDKVETVALTLSPCPDCAKLLCAHGIKKILYCEKSRDFETSNAILKLYKIKLVQVK